MQNSHKFLSISRQGLRFVSVGGVCYTIGLFTQWILTSHIRMHYLVSYGIAVVITSILNWLLNRKWTFESFDPQYVKEILRHQFINLSSLTLATAIYIALVSGLDINYLVANIIITPLMLIINFYLQRYLVFRKTG